MGTTASHDRNADVTRSNDLDDSPNTNSACSSDKNNANTVPITPAAKSLRHDDDGTSDTRPRVCSIEASLAKSWLSSPTASENINQHTTATMEDDNNDDRKFGT